ncbi:natural killer cell receptor 2B4-like [Grus japonensis]|uniref:Natural killer cell receptor 2B4-like n=1 Tax=Grus japonensis TaxID=30415 RepID=A0ABC9XUB4_GRUJA
MERGTFLLFVSTCFLCRAQDPVGQPHLEARILQQEQSWCNLSLHCTVPNTGNVSYNWSCTGDPPAALGHQPRLQLQVRGDTDPTVCCCNMSNLVSWSMASTDVVAACHSAASAGSWLYCGVKGLLSLLVLGSLVTAVAVTHGLIWCRGPPSRGAPTSAGLSLCCGTKLLKGLVGQSLSFPALHLMSADVARVTWRSRGTHIAEAKPREKIFTIDYLPDFRGRLLIHPTNLSLEIRRLNLADSGRYKVVVDTLSDPTNPKTFHYFLLVHGYGTLRRPYVLLPL